MVEAGFAGFHGLEPSAGNDLARLKRRFGKDIPLLGNVDLSVLCDGAPGGRYMTASCNSIFTGMNVKVVREMFRAEAEL